MGRRGADDGNGGGIVTATTACQKPPILSRPAIVRTDGGRGVGGSSERARIPVGPPLPPDPCNARLPDGSTVNRNVDQIKSMIVEAEEVDQALGMPYSSSMGVYGVWVGLVAEGGFWDYKLQRSGSQQLGNLNYGVTGSLLLPLDVLLRGAGAVQDPKSKGTGHWTDRSPSDYGDQHADIPAIRRGASECRGSR